MFKTIRLMFSVLLVSMITFLLFACKSKEIDLSNVSQVKPDTAKLTDAPNLNFTDMHNFVVDSISEQYTPFFFIIEGKFDISGDNDKKNIRINVTCMDGTTVEDLDLFLSMVLNYMCINAAEQDFRFKAPSIDNEGVYTDFGTVFNTYSLDIDAKNESGKVIRNDHINAGGKIPVDPRYIKE